MKIKQGLTLPQFVDKYASHSNNEDDYYDNKKMLKEAYNNGESVVSGVILDKIVQYNELLKQPLKKEMFVNEMIVTDKELDVYVDAEKKVIFKGWKINTQNKLYNDQLNLKYDIIIGKLETFPDKNGHYKYWNNIETLSNLFQAANGELEIQNIEL